MLHVILEFSQSVRYSIELWLSSSNTATSRAVGKEYITSNCILFIWHTPSTRVCVYTMKTGSHPISSGLFGGIQPVPVVYQHIPLCNVCTAFAFIFRLLQVAIIHIHIILPRHSLHITFITKFILWFSVNVFVFAISIFLFSFLSNCVIFLHLPLHAAAQTKQCEI